MEKLLGLINELEKNISNSKKNNSNISNASVDWHIEHSLMVINQISKAIKKSTPQEYTWKFNFSRAIVYTLNKIPRGKGKAPKPVQPEGEITEEKLKSNIEIARESVKNLPQLHSKNFFKHPLFGNLNLKATTKFLIIHTTHHIKIINDIVN